MDHIYELRKFTIFLTLVITNATKNRELLPASCLAENSYMGVPILISFPNEMDRHRHFGFTGILVSPAFWFHRHFGFTGILVSPAFLLRIRHSAPLCVSYFTLQGFFPNSARPDVRLSARQQPPINPKPRRGDTSSPTRKDWTSRLGLVPPGRHGRKRFRSGRSRPPGRSAQGGGSGRKQPTLFGRPSTDNERGLLTEMALVMPRTDRRA